jgi:hypothetical protein
VDGSGAGRGEAWLVKGCRTCVSKAVTAVTLYVAGPGALKSLNRACIHIYSREPIYIYILIEPTHTHTHTHTQQERKRRGVSAAHTSARWWRTCEHSYC